MSNVLAASVEWIQARRRSFALLLSNLFQCYHLRNPYFSVKSEIDCSTCDMSLTDA